MTHYLRTEADKMDEYRGMSPEEREAERAAREEAKDYRYEKWCDEDKECREAKDE